MGFGGCVECNRILLIGNTVAMAGGDIKSPHPQWYKANIKLFFTSCHEAKSIAPQFKLSVCENLETMTYFDKQLSP